MEIGSWKLLWLMLATNGDRCEERQKAFRDGYCFCCPHGEGEGGFKIRESLLASMESAWRIPLKEQGLWLSLKGALGS